MADKEVCEQRDIGIVEKNFFFVDTNNLDAVETRLYGFCIANDIEVGGGDLSIEDVEFSGAYSNGTYVLIQNIGDKIYISQDYSGSCGIYLFRQGDYFALSNSFLLLVNKLASEFSLTFNFDYANAYIVSELCSLAYSETLVNEIEVLPRNVQVVIGKREKSVEFIDIDYLEHSVEITSVEGLQLLDRWYTKWLCIIRELAAKSDNIMCDLSGGFDSRMIFGLFLHAGIDLDKVCFNSRENAKEDYKVASQIAEHFSVGLNSRECTGEITELGLEECINSQFYVKFGFHKEIYWTPTQYGHKPVFSFGGGGGECIRAWSFKKPKIYLEDECKRGVRYKYIDVSEAVRKIIRHAYEETVAKFPFADADGPELTQLMYRETRCRNHFGKNRMMAYYANDICLSPLMDSDLGKLYYCNSDNTNLDLLMAVIFTRYYPELLEFPFEGGRSICQETLEYAEKVNEILPFHRTTSKNMAVPQKRLIYLGDNKVFYSQKESICGSDADKLIYDAFKSDKVHKMIAAYFHEDMYEFADSSVKAKEFQSFREVIPLMGVYVVLNLIMSRGRKSHRSVFEQLQATIAHGLVNPTLRLKDTDTFMSSVYTFISSKDRFLFPFEKIPQNTSIILYGAGSVGQTYCMQLKKSGYCCVIAWVDQDSKIIGVDNPDIIVDNGTFDYIVIAIENEKVMEEIKNYLLSKGVEEQKIVWRDPRLWE